MFDYQGSMILLSMMSKLGPSSDPDQTLLAESSSVFNLHQVILTYPIMKMASRPILSGVVIRAHNTKCLPLVTLEANFGKL